MDNIDWLRHKYVHDIMKKVKDQQNEGQRPVLRTKLWCEFCREMKPAWEIVMVENNRSAFPLAKTPDINEQMACPECISKKALVKANSQAATEFEAMNLAIKDVAESLGMLK